MALIPNAPVMEQQRRARHSPSHHRAHDYIWAPTTLFHWCEYGAFGTNLLVGRPRGKRQFPQERPAPPPPHPRLNEGHNDDIDLFALISTCPTDRCCPRYPTCSRPRPPFTFVVDLSQTDANLPFRSSVVRTTHSHPSHSFFFFCLLCLCLHSPPFFSRTAIKPFSDPDFPSLHLLKCLYSFFPFLSIFFSSIYFCVYIFILLHNGTTSKYNNPCTHCLRMA